MLPIKSLIIASSILLSFATARPMPTPQMLNLKVGESNIWTQLEGAPILPRMAQMENVKVRPGGPEWTEVQGGEPITGEPLSASKIRRMLDARWW